MTATEPATWEEYVEAGCALLLAKREHDQRVRDYNPPDGLLGDERCAVEQYAYLADGPCWIQAISSAPWYATRAEAHAAAARILSLRGHGRSPLRIAFWRAGDYGPPRTLWQTLDAAEPESA